MTEAAQQIKAEISSYSSDDIEHYPGLEGVKKRPGMYIGDTNDGSGLHNMIKEVVDNAIDEVGEGFCDHIVVVLHDDGSVTVEDNGRGIPTGLKEIESDNGGEPRFISAATLVMTELHAGGKFSNKLYGTSGGTHGVGVSVVNALSDDLVMTIRRDGEVHRQSFQNGNAVTELKKIGSTDKTGTIIRFKPSERTFGDITFDYDKLHGRLREQAFLSKGLRIEVADKRDGRSIEKALLYENGLVDYVQFLMRESRPLNEKIIYFTGMHESVKVEIAMQWTLSSYNDELRFYANNINQIDGGTHAEGFRSALTRTLKNYINENKLNKSAKLNIEGQDIREGLTAVVSVKVNEPTFSSQTKDKLTSSNVRTAVEAIVGGRLKEFLEENPSEAKTIAERAIRSAVARVEARRIRDQKRKGGLNVALSGKLADCSEKDASKRELFLVEGESAGGSAKQARDRTFQAILPLKGKILNVIKSPQRMLDSDEIKALVAALGTGFAKEEEEFDIEDLKYHRIIIMTDADVDGSHIRTLLLTFFFKQMRQLVKDGYLYIAQPPLYKVTSRRKERYLLDDSEFDDFILDNTVDRAKIDLNGSGTLMTIEGDALKDLCNKHIIASNAMEKLAVRHDRHMLEILSLISGLDETQFDDRNEVENLATEIKNRIAEHPAASRQNISVELLTLKDQGEGVQYAIRISRSDPGAETVFLIDKNLLMARGFRRFIRHNSEIRSKVNNSTTEISVERGKNSSKHTCIWEAIDWLLSDAKKGITIQRYKGLGEMNAEQLWDTTMNKETRVLRQVSLEDEFTTNETFRDLMGEQVEPRREFIERNAFSVENLDV